MLELSQFSPKTTQIGLNRTKSGLNKLINGPKKVPVHADNRHRVALRITPLQIGRTLESQADHMGHRRILLPCIHSQMTLGQPRPPI